MITVDVDKALTIIYKYKNLRNIKIEDAAFAIDGKIIPVSDDAREDFKFTGMSLAEFIETYDWPVPANLCPSVDP